MMGKFAITSDNNLWKNTILIYPCFELAWKAEVLIFYQSLPVIQLVVGRLNQQSPLDYFPTFFSSSSLGFSETVGIFIPLMFNWNLSAREPNPLLSFPNPWIGRIHLLPGTDSVRRGPWGSTNSGPAYFITILTASANKYWDGTAHECPTLTLAHCLRLLYWPSSHRPGSDAVWCCTWGLGMVTSTSLFKMEPYGLAGFNLNTVKSPMFFLALSDEVASSRQFVLNTQVALRPFALMCLSNDIWWTNPTVVLSACSKRIFPSALRGEIVLNWWSFFESLHLTNKNQNNVWTSPLLCLLSPHMTLE